MTTYTIQWHRLGHTELKVSAATALVVLDDVFPSVDESATPHEILEELGSSSIETPGFSMWVSPVGADAERTQSVLTRVREAHADAINRIRSARA